MRKTNLCGERKTAEKPENVTQTKWLFRRFEINQKKTKPQKQRNTEAKQNLNQMVTWTVWNKPKENQTQKAKEHGSSAKHIKPKSWFIFQENRTPETHLETY